ncbi:Tellurite resistance protein TrgB [Candidatus Rhodobacter oscarellae]|uniref:ADP-ribose pyrophosphatase n=1 Tax=Candidatus Rhodobacter oscarellae TaxID=1675527 RepID=A0A0J9E308_9RHOB|nr:NUDIX domain-containing protein [Candidatus Rhodobacter lobularis]KMW57097.1 Tellurite resistance protein TrgB [Candidatus Rhodobacter lobularis]
MLGAEVPLAEVTLPGFRAGLTRQTHGAALVSAAGAQVRGAVADLSGLPQQRLEFWADVFGYQPRALPEIDAIGYGCAEAGQDWDLAAWQDRWGATVRRASEDVISFLGDRDPQTMRRSLEQIMVRAASWARAQAEETPMNMRHGFTAEDVETDAARKPYLDFFMLEEQDLRFRKFNGGVSATVQRAAFVSGDAVTVLPYDPVRDRVLVIEQFRFGPLLRGDRWPWSLEPIAGRIDPGESPADTAAREAQEEAGLAISRLESVANYYPSPGAVSEYLFSYVGIADLPDEAARIGGLEAEAEDIRGVILPFDGLMELLQSGEAQNGPLVLTALWLQAHRGRLRGAGSI